MEEVIDDFILGIWKNDRVLEMQRFAEEHGWDFILRARFSEQPTAVKGFHVFRGKRGKRFTGIMQIRYGDRPYDLRLYDYVYYSDGGKKRTTVIEIAVPGLYLHAFHIKPKKGLSSLFNFGGRNKHSSGVEKFAADYQLEGSDPEAIQLQIPDSVLEIISAQKDLSLEGDGHYLMYYYDRKQLPVLQFPAELQIAMEITDKLLHDREKEFV